MDIWCLFTSACTKSSFERGRGRLYKIRMTISYFTPSRWVSIALLGVLTLSPAGANAGVSPEEVKMFEDYKVLAEKGDASGQLQLGDCYSYGQGVAKDESRAFLWYGKAAQQGNATAQLNLSVCYEKGQGVAKDLDQAIVWLRKASEQGNPMARNNLAGHYSSGLGVEKDEVKAAALFRIDAERGYALSQRNLAVAYFYGRGVSRDLVEAYAYLTLASEDDALARKFRKVIEAEWAKSHSVLEVSPQIELGKKRAVELNREFQEKKAAKKAGK